MSVHVNNLLLSERILLLQGPMGSFFTRLAQWLEKQDIQCFKVNLNGGDQFDSRHMRQSFDFTGEYSQFSAWVEELLLQQEIDTVLCFGDCRQYHQVVKKLAQKHHIRFFAFEEGYIRPNFITFEQDGVNFFSNFLSHFKSTQCDMKQNVDTSDVANSYRLMVRSAVYYYWFMVRYALKYPHYRHHRQMSACKELFSWCVSAFRRVKNHYTEPKRFERFIEQHKKQYFVFALQVHNDFQIRMHSDLKCVNQYIELVIKNFAQHAASDQHLVLKHHPMDRGYRNYAQLINKLIKQHQLVGRVHYFCDVHLPTMIKHSLGFVTVNSTTGMQALYHQIPVKVLGYAIYNLPKLTNQRTLSNFWNHPGKVDSEYARYFRQELIDYSQLNGSFYGNSPWMVQYDVTQLKRFADPEDQVLMPEAD